MSGARIGVDVGGTFTDLVLAESPGDRLHTEKLLTTPDEPSRAVLDGIERILAKAGLSPSDVGGIVHGTTLVTNTIIERTGARVGLITTQGFRDSIEIGREIRYDLYDLFLEPSPTLVPRRWRVEVEGRIDAAGEVLVPLDREGVRAAALHLRDAARVEAIAVCFMHSYRNPEHERAAAEIIADACPELPVTLSYEVAPEIREFERASTACANAYVQPLMRGYLRSLTHQLAALGIRAPVFVMLSGGGIATVDQAVGFPIRLIESGPAGGAMAACHYGSLVGEASLISFDMGGTTAKVCLVEDGRPQRAHEFEAGRVRRFRKGSGIPLKITVVDMIEIGAGGGSLATVDAMGLLKVGPRSAGSVPGPVCYGRGAHRPAVTDADLLLGYLDPDHFLGGEMPLDLDPVAPAMRTHLADPLGTDVARVSTGIHEVVNENMAAATRRYLAEKGRDPRRYAMIAFGGAGPVHAYGLARKLDITRIIVPLGAGVTSALGFLVAPPAVDEVRSYVSDLETLDLDHVNALFAEMESVARGQLVEAGASRDDVSFTRSADMRHVGQGFEIEVPLAGERLGPQSRETMRRAFFESYEALFERRVEDVGVEAMSWRLLALASPPPLRLAFGTAPESPADPHKGTRSISVEGFGTVTADVYDRYRLPAGFECTGPAVIEERESTTVVGPQARIRVDGHRNLIIDLDR